MKYRNSLQITAELLDITKDSGMNGIKTTNLIQKTNMSHNRLKTLITIGQIRLRIPFSTLARVFLSEIKQN